MSEKRTLEILFLAIEIFLFFVFFTKISKDVGDIGLAAIGSLIVTAVVAPFIWVTLKGDNFIWKEGRYSTADLIADTKMSKYSLLGIACFVISLCLVSLGFFFARRVSNVIFDNLMLSGLIFLLISFISIAYGAFFAKQRRRNN